jgi:hypothetical protein
MFRIISIVILLSAALTAAAQTRTFRWDDELCRYSGTYDAKRFSEASLQNTLKLAAMGGHIPLSTSSTVFKFADIDTLDVHALDREYEKKSAELRSLEIVPVPYWETFRNRRLKEMEQAYRLNRVTMLAYKDPRSLLTYSDAPACTLKYARPLVSGGEDLLIAWRGLNEQLKKRNGDPDRLQRIYEEQMASPDRERYAMIEVITFGWSNCANGLIDHVAGDDVAVREFKKLFKRVRTIECEEP